MSKTFAFFGFACLSALSLGQVTNGGFELNTVGGGFNDLADDWFVVGDLFPNGIPDSWDNNGVNGNAPGTASLMTGATAFSGTKWSGLVSETVKDAMEYESIFLTAGQYTVSAALYADGTNNFDLNGLAEINIRLRIGPGGIAPIVGVLSANTANGIWEMRSSVITVETDGLHNLMLSNESDVRSYIGLDEVMLTPVPEPASLAILSLGAMALLRRGRP